MTDTKLAAEVVKLKQDVVALYDGLRRLAEGVELLAETVQLYHPKLKPLDDGRGHAEDGWPWDPDATDGIETGTRKPKS